MNAIVSILRLAAAVAVTGAVSTLSLACSGGEIAVGTTSQELKTKKDGTPTGNGSTCSWEGTTAFDNVSSNNTTSSQPSQPPTYDLGASFKSLDQCNDCSCTEKGIMCTLRTCSGGTSSSGGSVNPSPPTACPAWARICPDGTTARSGPNCEQICDAPKACTDDAKVCPDGSSVGRTGPNCEFAACPTLNACDADAKVCPDGSTVSRVLPTCQFAPCPSSGVACTADAKKCPNGSYVGRVAPSCEFAPCPQ
jgi:hypothetical protein